MQVQFATVVLDTTCRCDIPLQATEKGLLQLRELEQEVSEVVELTPEYAIAMWSPDAGKLIVSGTSKYDAPCFQIRDPRNRETPESGADVSPPSSVTPPPTPTVTPPRSLKRPVQKLNCTTSTESYDLQSLEIMTR